MLIVVPEKEARPADRNTMGGAPILCDGQSHPICGLCGATMVLFFQLDIPDDSDICAHAGCHLLVFMCPKHNEIPNQCYDGPRQPEFWSKDTGTFCLMLNRSGNREVVGDEDPFLVPTRLRFDQAEEEIVVLYDDVVSGDELFKIGGVPCRINFKVAATCGCGGAMSYLCQLPGDFGFPKKPDAPQQPDSFSANDYCLFLGNIVYVLACDNMCNPQAVTVILDN